MKLPLKAFEEKQLVSAHTSDPLTTTNKVSKVIVTTNQGTQVTGFKKPLNDHYNELLAKIAVGASVIVRMMIGEKGAEDRLYFVEKNGELVPGGTVSRAIPNFTAFNTWWEGRPVDEQEQSVKTPSTDDLLRSNILESLFVLFVFGQDDLHPKNISLQGVIDFDMMFWWLTRFVKEDRFTGGEPGYKPIIDPADIADFPELKVSNPTHWPTKSPENAYWPKAFVDTEVFSRLADNRGLEIDGEFVYPQDQYFSMALTILLSNTPELVEEQFKAVFGEITLNYKSCLKPEQITELEKRYPLLFNEQTDKEPFVKFMVRVYQIHYDRLYRTMMSFVGTTANSHGQPVPSFKAFLQSHPSIYREVQDRLMSNYQILFDQGLSPEFTEKVRTQLKAKWALLGFPPEVSPTDKLCFSDYCEESISRRYHKLWRDVFATELKEVTDDATEVLEELKKQSALKSTGGVKPIPVNTQAITEAIELFDFTLLSTQQESAYTLSGDNDTAILFIAKQKIEALNRRFLEALQQYYNKGYSFLSKTDNSTFIAALTGLVDSYTDVNKVIGKKVTAGLKLSRLITRLSKILHEINFQSHIAAEDRRMLPQRVAEPEKHRNEEVVQKTIEALFRWLTQSKKEEFFKGFNDAMNVYLPQNGVASFFVRRTREETAKKLMHSTFPLGNDVRLMLLLAQEGHETGILNQFLIEEYIKKMNEDLDHHGLCQAISVDPCIKDALDNRSFDFALYAQKAVEYAKSYPAIRRLKEDDFKRAVCHTLFEWLGELERERFKKFSDECLGEYKASLSWSNATSWFKFDNSEQYRVLFLDSNVSPQKAVAHTITKSTATGTLTDCILKKALMWIKDDILKKPELQAKPEYLDILALQEDQLKLQGYHAVFAKVAEDVAFSKQTEVTPS